MTRTGFGAILALLGGISLGFSPYLARQQVGLLNVVFQLDVRERGLRVIKSIYMVISAGLLLVGTVLMVLAQTGYVSDRPPDADSGGSDRVIAVVVGTFMAVTFILTLIIVVRQWRRGWPHSGDH